MDYANHVMFLVQTALVLLLIVLIFQHSAVLSAKPALTSIFAILVSLIILDILLTKNVYALMDILIRVLLLVKNAI
jgi:hypothetical protein